MAARGLAAPCNRAGMDCSRTSTRGSDTVGGGAGDEVGGGGDRLEGVVGAGGAQREPGGDGAGGDAHRHGDDARGKGLQCDRTGFGEGDAGVPEVPAGAADVPEDGVEAVGGGQAGAADDRPAQEIGIASAGDDGVDGVGQRCDVDVAGLEAGPSAVHETPTFRRGRGTCVRRTDRSAIRRRGIDETGLGQLGPGAAGGGTRGRDEDGDHASETRCARGRAVQRGTPAGMDPLRLPGVAPADGVFRGRHPAAAEAGGVRDALRFEAAGDGVAEADAAHRGDVTANSRKTPHGCDRAIGPRRVGHRPHPRLRSVGAPGPRRLTTRRRHGDCAV